MLVNRSSQRSAFLCGYRSPRSPYFGARYGWWLGCRRDLVLTTRRLQVIAGPVVTWVTSSMNDGAVLETTDTRFACAVVAGCGRWRWQPDDGVLGQELLKEFTLECGTIVTLEHQWRAMLLNKLSHDDDGRLG